MIDKQLPVILSAIRLGSYRPNHLTQVTYHPKYRVSIYWAYSNVNLFSYFRTFSNIFNAFLSGLSWKLVIYRPEDLRLGPFSIRHSNSTQQKVRIQMFPNFVCSAFGSALYFFFLSYHIASVLFLLIYKFQVYFLPINDCQSNGWCLREFL